MPVYLLYYVRYSCADEGEGEGTADKEKITDKERNETQR